MKHYKRQPRFDDKNGIPDFLPTIHQTVISIDIPICIDGLISLHQKISNLSVKNPRLYLCAAQT